MLSTVDIADLMAWKFPLDYLRGEILTTCYYNNANQLKKIKAYRKSWRTMSHYQTWFLETVLKKICGKYIRI